MFSCQQIEFALLIGH